MPTTKKHPYRRTEAQVRELIESMPRDPETGCWVWNRATRQGYGAFGWLGTVYDVHRLSYALYNGQEPGELQVLHQCDNRPCCNPQHLFLGTQKDNIDDMYTKQRQASKLTPEQVIEIRGRRGENQSALGREFAVSQSMISATQRGASWAAVAGETGGSRASLTERDVFLIRELAPGHTIKDLAQMFGVTQPTIANIVKRRSWKHLT
jgi:hypothetical protein